MRAAPLLDPWQGGERLGAETDTSSGSLFLRCINGAFVGNQFEVVRSIDPQRWPEVLGSDSSDPWVTVYIQDVTRNDDQTIGDLAGRHCSFKYDDGEFCVTDLGSDSGTWFAVRSDASVELTPDTVIDFNGIRYEVTWGQVIAEDLTIDGFLKAYGLESLGKRISIVLMNIIGQTSLSLEALNENSSAVREELMNDSSIRYDIYLLLITALSTLPQFIEAGRVGRLHLRLREMRVRSRLDTAAPLVDMTIGPSGAYLVPCMSDPDPSPQILSSVLEPDWDEFVNKTTADSTVGTTVDIIETPSPLVSPAVATPPAVATTLMRPPRRSIDDIPTERKEPVVPVAKPPPDKVIPPPNTTLVGTSQGNSTSSSTLGGTITTGATNTTDTTGTTNTTSTTTSTTKIIGTTNTLSTTNITSTSTTMSPDSIISSTTGNIAGTNINTTGTITTPASINNSTPGSTPPTTDVTTATEKVYLIGAAPEPGEYKKVPLVEVFNRNGQTTNKGSSQKKEASPPLSLRHTDVRYNVPQYHPKSIVRYTAAGREIDTDNNWHTQDNTETPPPPVVASRIDGIHGSTSPSFDDVQPDALSLGQAVERWLANVNPKAETILHFSPSRPYVLRVRGDCGSAALDARHATLPVATDVQGGAPLGLRTVDTPLPLAANAVNSELCGGLRGALVLPADEEPRKGCCRSLLRDLPDQIISQLFSHGLPNNLSDFLKSNSGPLGNFLRLALEQNRSSRNKTEFPITYNMAVVVPLGLPQPPLHPTQWAHKQLETLLRLRAWIKRLRDINYFETLQKEIGDGDDENQSTAYKAQFCSLDLGMLRNLLISGVVEGGAAAKVAAAKVASGKGSNTTTSHPSPPRTVIAIPMCCSPNIARIYFLGGKFYISLVGTEDHSQIDATKAAGVDDEQLCRVYIKLPPFKPHKIGPGDKVRLGRSIEFMAIRHPVGVAGLQGFRQKMEDEECVKYDLGELVSQGQLSCQFYAVYDGHGGRQCARFLASRLHESFTHQVYLQSPDLRISKSPDRAVYDALFRSFVLTDRAFLHFYGSHGRTVSPGCATIAVIHIHDTLYAAGCGDARAVVCRDGSAVELSDDHKPGRPDEVKRIEASGGFVRAKRVLGRLAVSRALGDLEYKNVGTDKAPVVLGEPEIRVLKLTPQDEFLLLACDGLFDVFTSDQAVQFAKEALVNHNGNPQAVAEALISEAIDGRKSRDNVTAIVVLLKSPT